MKNLSPLPAAPAPGQRTALFIIGTRPEAIKLAPVVLRAKARGVLRVLICATAQHRQMLDQVFEAFGLQADFDLNVMAPGQTLPALTARLMAALPDVLAAAAPHCAVVQGDTTTVLAGALAAFYEKVPVAHVEAGLRTNDPYAPFPEEINRRLIGPIARWHFAATEAARQNLLREGIAEAAVHVTGNTVIDALQQVAERVGPPPAELGLAGTVEEMGRPGSAGGRPLILITGHRRENFGTGMRDFCGALREIARRHPAAQLLYPVHPNPNVIGPVRELLGDTQNIKLTDPVDYPTFVSLMKASYLIITDSGGIQEEAPALGKPVLVTRSVTERPEGVAAGCSRLVGTDTQTIIDAAEQLLADPAAYARMAQAKNPFGDGHAADRICEVLEREA